jgi:hypothetical protein
VFIGIQLPEEEIRAAFAGLRPHLASLRAKRRHVFSPLVKDRDKMRVENVNQRFYK